MFTPEKITEHERSVLVGVVLPGQSHRECQENLQELELLALTAGLEVCASLIQERQKINPAFFIGSGKVADLNLLLRSRDANVVIFDEDLSPAQIRNLEKALNVKIIDRSTLILDIFAKHARTREAKTQVELAQLQYMLPRLTRHWLHLSRQVGGIGTRGPGETQLETDRRLVRKRIEKLRSELSQIDRQRIVRKKNRDRFFRAALIGYTNVGKSTIMNLLSGSHVLVEDQLFATLDSTNRRIRVNDDHHMILSDTVGFIRKLPHHLVASFKSTLDVVREADLLLHVVDAHHARYAEQMQTVMEVLEELGAHQKPIILIFNKIDLLPDANHLQQLSTKFPQAVFISATRHLGIEALKQRLVRFIEKEFRTFRLSIPIQNQKLIHYIHSVTAVVEQHYVDTTAELTFRTTHEIYHKILKKLNGLENLPREHYKIRG
ncbi:MAG: GTPase HflX [Calditrichia bacterium]